MTAPTTGEIFDIYIDALHDERNIEQLMNNPSLVRLMMDNIRFDFPDAPHLVVLLIAILEAQLIVHRQADENNNDPLFENDDLLDDIGNDELLHVLN
uniref:DUF5063 domain-containing protein n=1 Tax=Steinernema glaseri TaxID=37863 RepID=A0A1I7ZNC3_9BILA